MSQNTPELRQLVIARLQTVIDPETGADVWRMRLVEDLDVDERGRVSYGFRPSSPLCPIAVPLALAIQDVIRQTSGVTGQQIEVRDFVQADLLTELLNRLEQ
jgi:metal-sulfur cluster biosynthetic enzyme